MFAHMKQRCVLIFSAFLLLLSCGGRHGHRSQDAPVQKDTIYPLGFLTDTLYLRSGEVRRGETFSGLDRKSVV